MTQTSTAPGLSPQQLQELADARARGAKLRRMIAVAKFDAWGVAIFAGLTLAVALVSVSVIGVVVGAAMAIIAYVEFNGIARLRRLDPAAATVLANNQIFFGGILFTYAVYSLWSIYHNPGSFIGAVASSSDAAMLGIDLTKIARLIGWLIYGTLAAVAITVQGGTAVFYLSRRKYIDAYATRTPQWIIDAQRAGLPM